MKTKISLLLVIFTSMLNAQIPNQISVEDKIFGLSKFWQEVNYNFIYLDKVDKEEWDNLYKSLITEAQNTPNDYEYYKVLQKFCAYLKDGHTNVFFPSIIQDSIFNTNFGAYRLFLSNIDDKAIITKVNASRKEELPIGTEIIKVNGIPTNEHIKENVLPYISSSTEHILRDLSVSKMLENWVGTSYELELKLPNGKIKSLNLTHGATEEKELYPPSEIRLLEFKWIKKDMAYIALNSFSDWEIMDLFMDKLPEILKAEKLIIDLRNNGGGNTNIGREIIKYLTNDTILYGSKSQSRLHIPTYKAWGKWTQEKDTVNNFWSKQAYLSHRDQFYHDFPYDPYPTLNLDISRIEVPTAILIGHNTASAAEDFLIFADNQEHMVKIGEPTFGSTGQPMLFDMPSGGSGRVCTKKDTYPDGREFVGFGIQPDIMVKKTILSFVNNEDPVLTRAIEFLKKDN